MATPRNGTGIRSFPEKLLFHYSGPILGVLADKDGSSLY